MMNSLKQILTNFFIIGIVAAQLRSEIPISSLPSNLNGELDVKTSFSFIDPNHFNISHGFMTSMISNGNSLYSVTGLTNRISYQIFDKLIFNANIGFYMAQVPLQNNNPLNQQLSISYDTAITYKPTKNSFLQFRLQKLPHIKKYQTYSPFNLRFN